MKRAGISAESLRTGSPRMQPGLHRVEVEDAVADDDDLAVDRRARGEDVAERREFGEVAEERPRVP